MNPADLLKLPGVTLGPTVADGMAKLAATAPTATDEREFQATVVSLAESCGWWCFHVYNARKSKAGWPDQVMLRERAIVAELKVPPNTATAAQLNCLDRFRRAGIEAYLWTPNDWPEIIRVLQRKES